MAPRGRCILPLTRGSNAKFRIRDLVGLHCLHDRVARHIPLAAQQLPPLRLEHRCPDMLADDEPVLEVRTFARTGEDAAFALDGDAVVARSVDGRLHRPRIAFDAGDGVVEKIRAPLYPRPSRYRR